MKKSSIFLGIVLLLVSVSAQEFLAMETFTISERDNHCIRDFRLPVYVKHGLTYETEERIISVKIEPQVWSRRFRGKHTGYDFSKVLVMLAIKDSGGRTTADFESYLNCSLKDCEPNMAQPFLFWDHAGEDRADKAGEIFEVGTPIVIEDEYCRLTLSLVSFLEAYLAYLCVPGVEYCESDSECITFLRSLTLEVTVDYLTKYIGFLKLMESASDHVEKGDSLCETGEYDALHQYVKVQRAFF